MRLDQNIELVATVATVEFGSQRLESSKVVEGERERRDLQITCDRAAGALETITAVAVTQSSLTADGECVNKSSRALTMAEAVRSSVKLQSTTPANGGKGWTKVQYGRKKILNRRGAAQPLNDFKFRATDRTVSLYVSRVYVEITPADIVGFIKHKTNLDVKVFKINTVDNLFNTFKVYHLKR